MPSHTGMLPGQVFYDLAAGVADADVLMCLRLQKERMDCGLLSSIGEYAKLYQVNRDTVRLAKKDCLVMHPGPINRGIELDDVAADSDYSAITSQVENGIFVRMAALKWCFGDEEAKQTVKSSKGKAKA
jgi:aspartate carbamoyltransferase catalytic subunit